MNIALQEFLHFDHHYCDYIIFLFSTMYGKYLIT